MSLVYFLIAIQLLRPNETDAMNNHCTRYIVTRGTPYQACETLVVSPESVPCFKPPWAQLVAVDLAEGKVKWRVPYASPGSETLRKEYGSR